MTFAVAENPEDFSNTRLELFALEYLKDLNITRAGVRAGYAESTMRSHGHNMIDQPAVQATIKAELERRKGGLAAEADFVVRELLALASVDTAAAFDDKGNLLPIHQIPLDVRKAIAGVEVFEEFEGRGPERQHVGNTRKVRWWDRLKALELLGKYHQLFVDKLDVNVKGDLVTRIYAARQRGAAKPDDGSDLV